MAMYPTPPLSSMPPPAMPPQPRPPRAGAGRWFLPAAIAVLLVGGGVLVWRGMSGSGSRTMRSGAIPVASDGPEVTLAPGETVTPVTPATTLAPTTTTTMAETTTTAATTTVVATTAPPTTVPATEAPTTAPPTTAAATLPPATPAPTAPPTAPPNTPTTRVSPGGVTFTSNCTSPDGWTVGLPAGWYAGDAASGWQCALFDVQPVVVTNEGDVVWPIVVYASDNIDDEYHLYYNAEVYEMLSSASIQVDGYGADRLELRTTGVGELGAGVEMIVYIFVLDATHAVTMVGTAASLDYASVIKPIVDAMAGDMRFNR